MNEKLKKYIKREEYNPDNDKTEIWIGEFSNAPIDPINVISLVFIKEMLKFKIEL